MPFTPYHRFQNSHLLEKLTKRLKESGNISDECFNAYWRYHPALLHKLRSAKHNLDRLQERLTTTNIQEAADATGDFMFSVNMFIDGYFYNCGSALDILAREILVLFGEHLPDRVYFQTAHEKLSTSRAADPILQRLQDPSWKSDFSGYRNTLTHELIIAASFQIHIDAHGGVQTHRIVFPLPDDPRADPATRSYKRYPNAMDYLKENFGRVLRHINILYGDIIQRANHQGNLPL